MRRMASAEKRSSGSGTLIRTRNGRRLARRFVVCINNANYPASLELHKIYRILPDKEAEAEGDLRVIDESGEDYLYPADWFVRIEVPQAVKTSLLQKATVSVQSEIRMA